ncbi:MAG: hypothetical protein ACOCV1_02350 [Bacillota bacterium]
MRIYISLDSAIRDLHSTWKNFCSINFQNKIQDFFCEKWFDYKELTAPREEAERIINKWYDNGYFISIICKNKKSDIKWLNEHYIPYDEIANWPKFPCDYYIDSNLENCLFATSTDIKKSYYFTNFSEDQFFNFEFQDVLNVPENTNINKLNLLSNWSDLENL